MNQNIQSISQVHNSVMSQMHASLQNLGNSNNYISGILKEKVVPDRRNVELAMQLDQLKEKMKHFIYSYNQALKKAYHIK